ncbi:MAG: FKBP-type peptidyl-prolyl cis-trans isomerase [Candidatus Methanoperedens sp.]|nr:FKBP-type peptidyl-prolyl cis-trans isomerase [Candidatus Methanoperedens sp.]
MKKLIIILLASVILFSGCVGQDAVKPGDTVNVDYTGSLEDGTVFDTSIESVAVENNILIPGRQYKPLPFTVGNGEVVQGFDEGVIGMKPGDSRKLTIPPEMGYGSYNPGLIETYPRIEVVPAIIPRITKIPLEQFQTSFGENSKVGDIVTVPGMNINLTVLEISTDDVSLSYNFEVGDTIPSEGAPWNQTVIAIDETNITLDYGVKKNDTIQFPGTEWNTTVIDVTPENITIKHNAIPDTEIQTMFGPIRVSFNETSIIIDQNHKLAGKTLLFDVTLKSIEK